MSDKQRIDPSHMKAFRALRSRNVPTECPMCKRDVPWLLLTDGIGRTAALPINDVSGNSAGIAALALSCTNCGFVSLHSIDQLLMEYRAQQVEDERG